MRTVVRNLLAWTLTLALAAGSWLPLASLAGLVDADGLCGPALVLDDPDVLVLAASPASGDAGHCTFCHWRHSIAGASASAMIAIRLPGDPTLLRPIATTSDAGGVAPGTPSPRGPPAVS